MELGRIPDINQAQVNHNEKISKVENVNDKHGVDRNDQYKKILSPEISQNINEVLLDNVQFGFNKTSNDFFIRITENDITRTIPTANVMELKAIFLASIKSEQAQQSIRQG